MFLDFQSYWFKASNVVAFIRNKENEIMDKPERKILEKDNVDEKVMDQSTSNTYCAEDCRDNKTKGGALNKTVLKHIL